MPKQTMLLLTHPRESYTVSLIYDIDVEKAAVEATLDEGHGGVEKIAGDDNSYSFGRIRQHNMVSFCTLVFARAWRTYRDSVRYLRR